jgi:hypothetical protein
LKYLAAVESSLGTFRNDVAPEQTAATLRGVADVYEKLMRESRMSIWRSPFVKFRQRLKPAQQAGCLHRMEKETDGIFADYSIR